MKDTASLAITYHFGHHLKRSIAVRLETRCGFSACGVSLVVYRYTSEPLRPAYYCRKNHKNKASVERNGKRHRPRRGRAAREARKQTGPQ